MKGRKWMAMLLAVVMAMAMLTGCSSGSSDTASADSTETETESADTESEETQTGGSIGILVVSAGSQWCSDIVSSVTAAVEAAGYDVMVSDSQASTENELSGMENLINAGCKAIVVNAMNPSGLADLCKEAQDAGIYIIGWSDSLENYDALVVEDPESEGEMVTEAICDYLDETGTEEGGELAAIWLSDAQNPDSTAGVTMEAVSAAFESTLVEGRGMTIVNEQYASDTSQVMDLTEAILAANPDVNVIFCQNDEMCVAAAQTLESNGYGKDDVLVCGLDGNSEALSLIAGGESNVAATVFADTTTVGTLIGESIVQYLADGTLADVVVEYTLVNRDNAADYVTEE